MILTAIRPVFRKLKDAQGEPLDFYETVKHTAGNYGFDDCNAVPQPDQEKKKDRKRDGIAAGASRREA